MLNPKEIENKSFKIIENLMRERGSLKNFSGPKLSVVKRVIHTTGDPKIGESLYFSNNFYEGFKKAFKKRVIVTDVKMVAAGISKRIFKDLKVETYISDKDVSEKAKSMKVSRSYISMEKALNNNYKLFAIGNAPTALRKLIEYKDIDFIVGVPVGFVGAAEWKNELIKSKIPCITLPGRQGGSNIAAAIINALMKELKSELVY
ncbi:precorrin-8X methylmutase [Tepiditoga spiralis]|uniref:Precorrin-8X methylmutase n=1 Tax=Tepiditoga spiralis TaxID=2108365 RepID=A0A7G1GB97_9BACT|nr:precorrin-8X methylmutase [Tepiditoga spiralis]BBE31622.1 precorrin-8X methylmutase [Tepiditoga spiralis]